MFANGDPWEGRLRIGDETRRTPPRSVQPPEEAVVAFEAAYEEAHGEDGSVEGTGSGHAENERLFVLTGSAKDFQVGGLLWK